MFFILSVIFMFFYLIITVLQQVQACIVSIALCLASSFSSAQVCETAHLSSFQSNNILCTGISTCICSTKKYISNDYFKVMSDNERKYDYSNCVILSIIYISGPHKLQTEIWKGPPRQISFCSTTTINIYVLRI